MLFLLCGVVLSSVLCAQHFTVVAENGLSLREEPSATAKKIKTLPFRSSVRKLRGNTSPTLLQQGEEQIKGSWIKVQTPNEETGYVFDAYLLRLHYPERESYCEKSGNPCHARLFANDFSAIIYDYETDGNDYGARQDTLTTVEDIGVTLEDKLLHIMPKQAEDSVAVFLSFSETIRPDGNYKKEGQSWETFYKEHPYWKGYRPYKRLAGKNNFYRIPPIRFDLMEAWRKGNMNLADTLVEYSGEGGYIAATMLYQGIPAFYSIESALIKVVIYRNNQAPKTTYIVAHFTYGC